MSYLIEFEKFWHEKSYDLSYAINNPTRFHNNLAKKMKEFDSIADIDDYVLGLKNARESTRRIIVLFYEYLLKEKKVKKIVSVLPDMRFYDYPFERQLEIAKYLHTPKTPAEIREHFFIDERTVRADLQQLEDGIEVLGSTIRIEKDKKGRQISYKTTVHPVFLPLNLTEAYAMTVYLDKTIDNNDPNAQIIRDISERIKFQLSDYAWNRLFPKEERYKRNNDYLNDEVLARSREGIICYLMKSGQKCRFIWKDKEYVGRIVPVENYGFPYSVVTEDGTEFDAPLSEIDFIIDSLEYE